MSRLSETRGDQAAPAGPMTYSPVEAHVADLELARRAAWGGVRAQRAIAERMVARVRRAAVALVGPDADVEDATQHALVEVLRSVHIYRPKRSLVHWGDRVAAQSIVRFARAFHNREDKPTEAVRPASPPVGRARRPLRAPEDYLPSLPQPAREVLLLHHVFGFGLPRVARLTQRPVPVVREQLRSALRRVFELAVADPSQRDAVERWLELRDQLLYGRGGSQRDGQELAELAVGSGAVTRLEEHIEQLASYQDTDVGRSLSAHDRAIVRKALSIVALSSAAASARPVDHDHADRVGAEVDARRTRVPKVSVWLCVAMVVLAGAGLFRKARGDYVTLVAARFVRDAIAAVGGSGRVARLLGIPSSSASGEGAGIASALGAPPAAQLLADAAKYLEDDEPRRSLAVLSQLLREYDGAPEARDALVLLGTIRLEALDEPLSALAAFNLYLDKGDASGGLAERAMLGRIAALDRLGRQAEREAAIQDFLRFRAAEARGGQQR